MVTVDWDTGTPFAVLRNAREILVFTYLADRSILPEPILHFIGEEQIGRVLDGLLDDTVPPDPRIRMFDYHRDRPEIGRQGPAHPPGLTR